MAPVPQSWSTRDHNSELEFWNLFDNEDQGKTTSLAHLATTHYQLHRRPLRIALDQDSWDYGISRQKEREIQKSQRAAFNKRKKKEQERIWCKKYNPSEKLRLFHREINVLVRLMGYIALGIEFYVIVPSPLSRDEVGEFGDRYKHANGKMHMWFRILGDLGIRFHAATNPVVECAHMQATGVVDAIWTNNPDIIAYSGPKAVIFRDHVQGENGTNFQDVRVYQMEDLRRKLVGSEIVFMHALFRSGYSASEVVRIEQMDNFVRSIAIDRAQALCECRNQEEVNKWFEGSMASYYGPGNTNKFKYKLIEDCLVSSAGSDSRYIREAEVFLQRRDARMQEIKDTREDNFTFYNANMMDRTRRLWEYARDTFSMKGAQFLSLMAGVLVARRLISGSTDPSSTAGMVADVDPQTVQIPFKIEDEPTLWNLRIKMKENISGMVLNPTILKALVVEVHVAYPGAGKPIDSAPAPEINIRSRKRTRRKH
ncbi:hypothetical protein TWF281_005451 [Arthrobotrys megalospora]